MSDEQAVRQRGQDIAFRIRAELVCCHIYDQVQSGKLSREEAADARRGRHALCYWGEAAARIAEGRCPGYETTPNICQCGCTGCQSNCSAHIEEHSQT